jgi:hypothetical protein
MPITAARPVEAASIPKDLDFFPCGANPTAIETDIDQNNECAIATTTLLNTNVSKFLEKKDSACPTTNITRSIINSVFLFILAVNKVTGKEMHATVNAYTVISSPACVIPRPKLSLIWLNIPTGIYSVELKVKAAKHSVTTLIQGLYLDRFNAGGI